LRRVTILPEAKKDLSRIAAYGVDHYGKARASEYIDDLVMFCREHIAEFPDLGREYGRGVRFQLFDNRYWVFYSYAKASIEVRRIIETRGDLETILGRKSSS